MHIVAPQLLFVSRRRARSKQVPRSHKQQGQGELRHLLQLVLVLLCPPPENTTPVSGEEGTPAAADVGLALPGQAAAAMC